MRTALVIDRSSSVPLGRQVYDFWRVGILSGRFACGERVPSTREVATALSLARGTIAQAYEQLVSEGYFQATRGSGTFVCRQLPDELLNAPAAARRAAFTTSAPLSSFGRRLPKDLPYLGKQPGHVCLSHWGPDLSLFPLEIWSRLYAHSLRNLGPAALDYSERERGYEPLCEEIAKYVSRSRAVSCSADQVIVVNGSSQGLDLCARLLLEPGDEVVLENPGYTGASRVFEACGARLRAIPVDAEGMVCSRLGAPSKLVYVTPAHQFPTGVTLSLRRRLELLAWARQHGAVIIEDDYDSEYRYSGAPMPALQGLASAVPVVYCGTFSKVMFPGLRVGYLIVPQSMVTAFARAKWLVDRQTPLHQQAALHLFMRDGHLERHIRRMRRVYGSRRAALVEALQEHLGEEVSVLGDAAGLHAYVRCHDPDVGARAKRNKVQLREAAPYYLGKAPGNDYLLGFSMWTERILRAAIKRLAPVTKPST
jgi:GntR family transcriptional regulator/MocR family aminotransferase